MIYVIAHRYIWIISWHTSVIKPAMIRVFVFYPDICLKRQVPHVSIRTHWQLIMSPTLIAQVLPVSGENELYAMYGQRELLDFHKCNPIMITLYLTLLHSERPKLCGVLTSLSVIVLRHDKLKPIAEDNILVRALAVRGLIRGGFLSKPA